MDLGVPPPPESLYTPEALFLGRTDDPASYTSTPDARAYSSFVASGRRTVTDYEVAKAQSAHDTAVTHVLGRALEGRRPVAVMGGHKMTRGDEGYRAVAEVSRLLAREGLLVLTGGGPGAMEAAHLGARLRDSSPGELAEAVDAISADRDQATFPLTSDKQLIGDDGRYVAAGVARVHAWQQPAFRLAADTADVARPTYGIPTWLYGHEPSTPLATGHAKYFSNSIREDGLLAVATDGIVFAPGSAGTLQEIYQDAAQNHYRSIDNRFSPMVFLDLGGVWTARFAVDTALTALFAPEYYSRFVTFTTDLAAVVKAIAEPPAQP